MNSIFRFTLNMHNHRSQASISCFHGDTAIRLIITLVDGGNPFAIKEGCVAILSGTKADGKKLWDRCIIVGNTIQYDFHEQTASCKGITNCEVTLYGADGAVITAPKFTMVVDEREFTADDLYSVPHTDVFDPDRLVAIYNAEETRDKAELGRAEAEEARVSLYEQMKGLTGSGRGSIQQAQDQESNVTEDYFNFTNKNPNATELDPTLTGEILYGATGEFASSFGGKGAAMGKRSHQTGSVTIAKGNYSSAGGCDSVALGDASCAQGYKTTAKGNYSSAKGMNTLAGGACSSAEGKDTVAGHEASHAEGDGTNAQGYASHVEGIDNTVEGDAEAGHAQGRGNIVSGPCAHAEGGFNKVYGKYSHAQGENNVIDESAAFASGIENIVRNRGAQALGRGLITDRLHQIVVGTYNETDSNAVFIVGNGTDDDNRSNAFVVHHDGTIKSGFIDDISTSLDSIIAIQNSLIGGEQ